MKIFKTVPEPAFVWERSKTLALAKEGCTHCDGEGMRGSEPCKCVLRQIFRACYRKWCFVQSHECGMTARYEQVFVGGQRRTVVGRKDEEFSADFYLVSRRALAADLVAWRIFVLHYVQGHPWAHCCEKLELDRGNFFHECYRIEAKLGRVFRELRPYSLFPIDEYYAHVVGRKLSIPPMPEKKTRRRRLCPVLKMPTPAARPIAQALAA